MWYLPALLLLSVASSAARWGSPLLSLSPQGLGKDFPPFAGLRKASNSDHKHEDEHEWTDMPGRMAMKYFVPPSRARDFKMAWFKLKDAVEQKEEEHEVFGLEKSGIDNWVWWSYGEWEDLDALWHHYESEWYEDFASEVDNMGAMWEAFWLGEAGFYSKEGEKRHGTDEAHSDNKFSVVSTWLVPPKEKMDFVETWQKAAENIMKEDESIQMLSLYKDWMTGSRFYSYAAWDSFDAFEDHMKSHHHSELLEWAADKDAYFMVEPLMNANRDEHGHDHDDEHDHNRE